MAGKLFPTQSHRRQHPAGSCAVTGNGQSAGALYGLTTGDDLATYIHIAKSEDGGSRFGKPCIVAPDNVYSDAPKLMAYSISSMRKAGQGRSTSTRSITPGPQTAANLIRRSAFRRPCPTPPKTQPFLHLASTMPGVSLCCSNCSRIIGSVRAD